MAYEETHSIFSESGAVDISPQAARLTYVAVALAIVLMISQLVRVALRLHIDYFDTYHIFLNARAIVAGGGSLFDIYRPIGICLLYAPIFALEQTRIASLIPFPLCHLLALGVFTLWLVVLYRLFRLQLSALGALFGVFFIALNPLIVHLAPFAKEDIPAALFTTIAFYGFLRWRESRRERYFLATLAFSAAAMATRYNLIPLIPILLGTFTLADGKPGKTRWLRPAILAFVPVGIFLLAASAVYWRLGRSPSLFVRDLVQQFRFNHAFGYKPPIAAYLFLARSFPPAFLIAALVGIGNGLYRWKTSRREKETLFFLAWLLGFFLFQAYVVPGKEARYLLPLFPPMAFFIVRGVSTTFSWLDNILRSSFARVWLVTLTVFFFAVAPMGIALREQLKFEDEAYTTPYAETVSREAARLSEGHRIFWIGPYYPQHPRQYVFHSWDDYAYLYHFSADTLSFYARKPVLTIMPGEVGRYAKTGDVLVVNSEPEAYRTWNVPQTLKPLTVEKIDAFVFHRRADGTGITLPRYSDVRRFPAP